MKLGFLYEFKVSATLGDTNQEVFTKIRRVVPVQNRGHGPLTTNLHERMRRRGQVSYKHKGQLPNSSWGTERMELGQSCPQQWEAAEAFTWSPGRVLKHTLNAECSQQSCELANLRLLRWACKSCNHFSKFRAHTICSRAVHFMLSVTLHQQSYFKL